jgi:hypothetical protein
VQVVRGHLGELLELRVASREVGGEPRALLLEAHLGPPAPEVLADLAGDGP